MRLGLNHVGTDTNYMFKQKPRLQARPKFPQGYLARMAFEIRPLVPDDLSALSRFLTQGFGTAPDAPFAAPDVLRWKYFDPRGSLDVPRSWIAREDDQIVGHLGLTTGAFLGDGLPGGEVSTLHMIDWLSARPGSGIGARLLLRAHQGVATGYGLGGSNAGRSVGGGGGYRLIGMVPVFQRVLRPALALRQGKVARWARDLVRNVQNPPQKPRTTLEFQRLDAFGPEILPILDAYRHLALFTDRRPPLLNHMLRYPRGGITGGLLLHAGNVRGFGLLSLVEQGGAHVGKIVDCVLDTSDLDLWHSAYRALTDALAEQGASSAVGFASTGWSAHALQACGFASRHGLEFRLRDKQGLVPAGAVVHLTPLEADYVYT